MFKTSVQLIENSDINTSFLDNSNVHNFISITMEIEHYEKHFVRI